MDTLFRAMVYLRRYRKPPNLNPDIEQAVDILYECMKAIYLEDK